MSVSRRLIKYYETLTHTITEALELDLKPDLRSEILETLRKVKRDRRSPS